MMLDAMHEQMQVFALIITTKFEVYVRRKSRHVSWKGLGNP